MQLKTVSRTDVGLVRKANEDNFGHAATPNGELFVVCDGMGGHVGGATASKLAVDCILEFLNRKREESAGQLISDAIKFANTQVFATAMHDAGLKGMGSTCVVLLITSDGYAWTGHVGDSRIYLFRNKKLSRLTKDHSYVQYLVDTGEIKEEEAESHPKKNQILRALGSDEDVKPEICAVPFQPESKDIFLLCSDGLTGMVHDNDVEKIMSENDLDQMPVKLVDAALANGGKDNVTALMVEVNGVSGSKISPPDTTLFASRTSAVSGNKNNRIILILLAVVLLGGAAFSVWYFGLRESAKETKTEVKKEPVNSNKSEEKKENKVQPAPDKKAQPEPENKPVKPDTQTKKTI